MVLPGNLTIRTHGLGVVVEQTLGLIDTEALCLNVHYTCFIHSTIRRSHTPPSKCLDTTDLTSDC